MPSGYRWSYATFVGLSQNTRTVRAGGGPEVGEEEAVGVGEPDTPPVQATPLSVKLAGTGLAVVHEPLTPTDAVPPVPMLPLYPALTAVTAVPLCVTVAFHAWVTACPAVKLHVKVQAVIGSPRLVTATFAPNPPVHCEPTV